MQPGGDRTHTDRELAVARLGVDDDGPGAAGGVEADLELVPQHDLARFGAHRGRTRVDRVGPQPDRPIGRAKRPHRRGRAPRPLMSTGWAMLRGPNGSRVAAGVEIAVVTLTA